MCQIMVEEKSIHCVRFGLNEANHNEVQAVNNSPCEADGRLSKLPAGMPQTDAEKSVLSKGLSFVPIRKATTIVSVSRPIFIITAITATAILYPPQGLHLDSFRW